MNFMNRKMDRFRTNSPVSTLTILVGSILVTIASIFPPNDTVLKYSLGFIGLALVNFDETGEANKLIDYFSILNIPNLFLFSLPFLVAIWLCRKHLTDWLSTFLLAVWLGCSIWVYTQSSHYPLYVLLSMVAYFIPAFTIVLLSESGIGRWLLLSVWFGVPFWVLSKGWVNPAFVVVSVSAVFVLALMIILLSKTRFSRWTPSSLIAVWSGLYLWAYVAGPSVY